MRYIANGYRIIRDNVALPYKSMSFPMVTSGRKSYSKEATVKRSFIRLTGVSLQSNFIDLPIVLIVTFCRIYSNLLLKLKRSPNIYIHSIWMWIHVFYSHLLSPRPINYSPGIIHNNWIYIFYSPILLENESCDPSSSPTSHTPSQNSLICSSSSCTPPLSPPPSRFHSQ